MAKQRYIDTKFWDDGYIVKLDTTEKLLFLYCLTNPLTNISGIYEIALKRIAFDTGIDSDSVLTILKRFERDKKIFYIEEWMIICNFPKFQDIENSPKIKRGIEISLSKLPQKIRYTMDTLSIPYLYPLNYSNTNSNTNSNNNSENSKNEFSRGSPLNDETYDPAFEEDESVVKKKNPVKKYKELLFWAQRRRSEHESINFVFPSAPSQFKAMRLLKDAGVSMAKIKERWIELEADPPKEGFDFHTILWSLSKKP